MENNKLWFQFLPSSEILLELGYNNLDELCDDYRNSEYFNIKNECILKTFGYKLEIINIDNNLYLQSCKV